MTDYFCELFYLVKYVRAYRFRGSKHGYGPSEYYKFVRLKCNNEKIEVYYDRYILCGFQNGKEIFKNKRLELSSDFKFIRSKHKLIKVEIDL